MKVNKITTGFVIQTFEIDGDKENPVSQEFIAGDQVDREDENGEPVDWIEKEYLPFDMVQPGSIQLSQVEVKSLQESMQDNMIAFLDSMPSGVVDGACQVIVDKIQLMLRKKRFSR